MRKRVSRSIVVIVLFMQCHAFAQTTTPRFEVGPIFSCFTSCGEGPSTRGRGYGGRGTFNFTNYFGAEFQASGNSGLIC